MKKSQISKKNPSYSLSNSTRLKPNITKTENKLHNHNKNLQIEWERKKSSDMTCITLADYYSILNVKVEYIKEWNSSLESLATSCFMYKICEGINKVWRYSYDKLLDHITLYFIHCCTSNISVDYLKSYMHAT